MTTLDQSDRPLKKFKHCSQLHLVAPEPWGQRGHYPSSKHHLWEWGSNILLSPPPTNYDLLISKTRKKHVS
jgi:hypothetical protein